MPAQSLSRAKMLLSAGSSGLGVNVLAIENASVSPDDCPAASLADSVTLPVANPLRGALTVVAVHSPSPGNTKQTRVP